MNMKQQTAVVVLVMLALAETALASTGIPGLDNLFLTTDGAIGSTGYMLFIVAILGILGSLWSGHYYMTFGLLVAAGLGGAFVGHRAQFGSTLSLTLGAELLPVWPLDLMP